MDRPRFRASFLHPRFWLLWLGLGLLWLVVQLPYPVLLWLGRGLGALMYRVARSRRQIARRNLQLCFPELSEKERERLLRENFISTGIAFFEMAMSWWWPKSRLQRLAQIQGLEHLQQAQAEGQGVILMTLHFTTLEIGGALLGQWHTIDGMYREHKNPVFDAPDQDYGRKQSIFVPWFGIQAATVTATTKFARLGRARVIPYTLERLPEGRGYSLVVHPPLDDFPGESEEADCRRINEWIEDAVRQHPEQYLWAHRRFKTRPEGESSLYRKRPKKPVSV